MLCPGTTDWHWERRNSFEYREHGGRRTQARATRVIPVNQDTLAQAALAGEGYEVQKEYFQC
jgi:hypothetical protein